MNWRTDIFIFFPVQVSLPTKWTLTWPCLPVLEVDTSTILHGRPLSTTEPFLHNAEHCTGKVAEPPHLLSRSPNHLSFLEALIPTRENAVVLLKQEAQDLLPPNSPCEHI